MRTSLAVAAAALALFSAPIASAAEAPAATTASENTESTGFTFYKSFGREFADHFRCSTSPQRWWCG
ncbi:hypothetical protein [Corynebacterium aurimucosum]|uniref:hypothetical protein n=1 Tax=Corynebacterium aurimucosum TaxID=169292 RepID=UPI000C80A7C4|nr:hypothetical protein [Corynebacterium aurimucosum]PMC69637.1 hypothetical protein CJ201_08270 [Corynebacterium aurimucosum]